MMGLLPGVDNWAWFTTVMLFATIPTIVSYHFILLPLIIKMIISLIVFYIFTMILKSMFYHNSSGATILFVFFSELFSLYAFSILVRYASNTKYESNNSSSFKIVCLSIRQSLLVFSDSFLPLL